MTTLAEVKKQLDDLTIRVTNIEINQRIPLIDDYAIAFEEARKLYPGKKVGWLTEYKNFKKHKDWKKAMPLLVPAIQRQIDAKILVSKEDKYTPHFATWIHLRRWELEVSDPPKQGMVCAKCGRQTTSLTDRLCEDCYWRQK